jgi:hypothetical protein
MRIASVLACLIIYSPFFLADLVSCWLQVRRRRQGRALSAWPLAVLLLYIGILLPLSSFELQLKWIAIGIAVPLHLIVTQLVPRLFPSRSLRQG